ncbi:MAG: hypothetical protein ACOX55_13175 [Christensenellales bacterium]|jgi:hypothetical protein
MLEQFLRYSLAHGRAIRVILMKNGVMSTRTITVLSFDDSVITYRAGTHGKLQQMDRADLLSASYARGDQGSLEEGNK